MRFAFLFVLALCGAASAQCPNCPKPAAAAPATVWVPAPPPMVVYQQMPVQYLQAPAPVLMAPPPPRVVYAVPMTGVPVMVVQQPKKFPTPIRDFFFGRY